MSHLSKYKENEQNECPSLNENVGSWVLRKLDYPSKGLFLCSWMKSAKNCLCDFLALCVLKNK